MGELISYPVSSALRNQKTLTAYLECNQLLQFCFARRHYYPLITLGAKSLYNHFVVKFLISYFGQPCQK